jgi:hypothetical protein
MGNWDSFCKAGDFIYVHTLAFYKASVEGWKFSLPQKYFQDVIFFRQI